jgi:hypothetical protein
MNREAWNSIRQEVMKFCTEDNVVCVADKEVLACCKFSICVNESTVVTI